MGALNRRTFLRAGLGAAATIGGAGLYARFGELHWIEVVDRPLPIRGLPDALVGRQLVQLSDVHVGPRVDDEYVVRAFERVRAWDPDLVVYTGDYVTRADLPRTFEQARRVYAGLPHGRLGTVGILGNHDYGPNWAHGDIADRVEALLAGHGVTVLRNRVCEIEGLQFGGLDDLWAEQFRATPVFEKLDLARPALILSHNPDTADIPQWHDYRGWILSGHTHGGQCRIPPFPPPLLPVVNRRYAAGEVRLADGRTLYVNRGLGHLLPFRFGVRPEITRFRLARA